MLQILYNEFTNEFTLIKLFVFVLHVIPNLEVAAFVQFLLVTFTFLKAWNILGKNETFALNYTECSISILDRNEDFPTSMVPRSFHFCDKFCAWVLGESECKYLCIIAINLATQYT